jgi:ABC-type microcin C transport system permease subunit YejB
MLAYILRRLLLVVPTLLGILLINFIIVQAAPGGPVEQAIAKAKGLDTRGNPVSGGNAGDMAYRRQQQRQGEPLSRRPGAGPRTDQGSGTAIRLRQTAGRALPPDVAQLPEF